MDAFYASVELLKRPDLKGRPVAIGGHGNPDSRGVVTTATYEARAFGIHSGMALRRAAQLCPHCEFLPTDFPAYRKMSASFKQAVRQIAPLVEDRGIDEIYIDLSELPGVRADRGAAVAARLQAAVQRATGGLTCSIGVAPNKLLAKMASEFNKPDGVAIIETDEIEARIWPLPVRKINGIGPKATDKLAQLGINTIGELAAVDAHWLSRRFGRSYGPWLHEVAWGRDSRPVVTHSEPVSRSRETTFDKDMHLHHDREQLQTILERLTHQLASDLASRRYAGSTIGVKVRYSDFSITTRDLSVAQATNDGRQVLHAVLHCLGKIPANRRIRLIGVRVGALVKLTDHGAQAHNTSPLALDPAGANRPADPSSTRSSADPYTPDLFGFDEPGT